MSREWDVIVIGSGFGGVFTALPLVQAGARVLMLERGPWVERGQHNWSPEGTMEKTPYYSYESPGQVLEGGQTPVIGQTSCVGGASVFYGGVCFRLRPADFTPSAEIVGDSGAAWPLRYADLETWYERCEELLEVAGEAGADPSEAPRRGPYPAPPGPLGETAMLVANAGRGLGLRPFPLPMAIRYRGERACVLCPTCDTFACAVSAKNDLATDLIPRLQRRGMELRPETVVTRLVAQGGRVSGVEALDKRRGQRETLRAGQVVLAGGALATPHLLLASGLAGLNPAGAAVGRYLTRHCNGIVIAVFKRVPDGGRRFHKQVGFHDFYFGAPGAPEGTLGSIQQLQQPPLSLVKANAPRLAHGFLELALPHTTGLLVMAEDEPRAHNAITLDPARRDAFGLPRLVLRHRYTKRDLAAREVLFGQARRILRAAGAFFFYRHPIKTCSHAAGTVRCGDDPRTAPLDRDCRYRGLENLVVTDASFLPTGGGVNPSLTIAANALRVGTLMASGKSSPDVASEAHA